jgi:hypothetical protein
MPQCERRSHERMTMQKAKANPKNKRTKTKNNDSRKVASEALAPRLHIASLLRRHA